MKMLSIQTSTVELTLLFLAKSFKQLVHIQKVIPFGILTTKRITTLYKYTTNNALKYPVPKDINPSSTTPWPTSKTVHD